jgi:hypothetical protein
LQSDQNTDLVWEWNFGVNAVKLEKFDAIEFETEKAVVFGRYPAVGWSATTGVDGSGMRREKTSGVSVLRM